MLGSYIRRGALAGLAGGAASALVLLLVGESTIGDAIRLEEAKGGGGHEVFSRGVQIFGGALGVGFVSIAIGVMFAVTFAAVRHRLPGRDDWQRAVVWGATAFVVVYLVPLAKFPANPPAVGDPDTINERTLLYAAMLAWSIGAAWAGAWLAMWLRGRQVTDSVRLSATAVAWVLLVAVGYVLIPGSPDAVAAPATLVWRFRLVSAGGALTLWLVTGVAFGWLSLAAARRAAHSRPEVRTGAEV
jgi:predicted cobalt transporter CbtA